MLETAREMFGYTPNIVVEMSNNVATTKAYLTLQSVLREHGTLTLQEQEITMLAAAAWHRCEYSMAAHRTGAKRAGIAQADIDRISRLEIPADARLQALTAATWALMDTEGFLGGEDLETFDELGIEKAQLYEIVALIAMELIAHCVDAIEKTPLDAAILSQRVRANSDGRH
ncbi:MAG TPA: carboxymuconolactone decarboxylase family protein [Woeseiaceae bacterium]|nr:carboxymuconolactone decarboxylase family protein [Woeseiaceae bacterium]